MKLNRLSFLRILMLGTLTLFVVVFASYVINTYRLSENYPSYKCEGECVPVRFEVTTPNAPHMNHVYLSGSFNGWSHADEKLLFTQDSDSTYSLDIELPRGRSIKYRYSVSGGRNSQSGYAETLKGNNYPHRLIEASSGLVIREDVEHWDQYLLYKGPLFLEQVPGVQYKFLEAQAALDSISVSDSAELDALFEQAEALWGEESRAYFIGLEQLSSRTYYALFIENYARKNGVADFLNGDLACSMLLNYALPAYLRELDYLLEDVRIRKKDIIGNGLLLLDAIYCEDISEDDWQSLLTIYEQLPLAMDAFLEVDDPRWKNYLARQISHQKNRHASYRVDYEYQNAVSNGNWEEAIQMLETVLVDSSRQKMGMSQFERRVDFMAKHLANGLALNSRRDRAFEVLDALSASVSGYELSSDKLRTWYQAIGGAEGAQRFQALEKKTNRYSLDGNGAPIEFAGTYLNITDSTMFDVASLQGKTVIMEFWETWCGPCIAEIPSFVAFQNTYNDREDVVFVSVSLDAVSAAEKTKPASAVPAKIASLKQSLEGIARSKGINYILLYDDPQNPISRHFDVKYYPIKYLVNAKGRLVSEIKSPFDVPL